MLQIGDTSELPRDNPDLLPGRCHTSNQGEIDPPDLSVLQLDETTSRQPDNPWLPPTPRNTSLRVESVQWPDLGPQPVDTTGPPPDNLV